MFRNPANARYMDYSAPDVRMGIQDYSSVPPYVGAAYEQTIGPHPKPEPGVKFRPLAFYDQVEPILKTSKIPGNGTRLSGTQFYIRIEKADMDKFISGQVNDFDKHGSTDTLLYILDLVQGTIHIPAAICRYVTSGHGNNGISR